MKKIALVLSLLLLAGSLMAVATVNTNFLTTAIAVGAGATATNGTTFTSKSINVPAGVGAITITFTRAAGSASTVDFYFEVSADNETTWATFSGSTISVATNTTVVSGTTVRVLTQYNFRGITHIRWWKVVNGDGANALTAVNVTLSY